MRAGSAKPEDVATTIAAVRILNLCACRHHRTWNGHCMNERSLRRCFWKTSSHRSVDSSTITASGKLGWGGPYDVYLQEELQNAVNRVDQGPRWGFLSAEQLWQHAQAR